MSDALPIMTGHAAHVIPGKSVYREIEAAVAPTRGGIAAQATEQRKLINSVRSPQEENSKIIHEYEQPDPESRAR